MNHSRYSQDALKQCQDEIANLKYELAMSKHALASLKQQAHKHEKQSELFSELRTMTLQELAESQQENASLRLQIENMVSSQSLRRTSYTPMNGSHQKDAEEALIAILNQDSDGQGSIGPVIVTPGYLPFSLLPDEIQSIDSGMNALPAIKSAPMRFIRLDSFLSWTSLVVYEEVKQADMIEVPYEDVDDEQWSRAAVLSWRWHASKPWTYEQYLARPGHARCQSHVSRAVQRASRGSGCQSIIC